MAFDPYQPYGPVVDTRLRVVTWNVWGRYGDIDAREAGIEDTLARVNPDIVCLVESWATDDEQQVDRVAARLGLEHAWFVGGRDGGGWTSGAGIVSRWPIVEHESRPLGNHDIGMVLFAAIDGPRGRVQVFVVMLDWPLHASTVRQDQVRELGVCIAELARRRHPIVVCGDFNAGPDADELRMLTGRSETVQPGLVFYDAWEIAGDGSPGHTWSNANSLAAIGLYPDRRFDYVLSAWPQLGGVGHPTHCEILGRVERGSGAPELSDHYGVLADLRY
jgi:endonuclease/exonuclease/phosphatase family metal-dependent hydrolase